MVHGVDSFQAYVAAANKYDASFAARMIGDILYIERQAPCRNAAHGPLLNRCATLRDCALQSS